MRDALAEHGTVAAAARALNISESTARNQHRALVIRGDIPGKKEDDLKIYGTSTLYDSEGNVLLEWEKRKADAEQIQAKIRETIAAFVEPLKGTAKPVKPPKSTLKDLKTEYILTDLHLGQYSWAAETGADYDLDKAVSLAGQALERLVEAAPASETCILNQMGDYYHADSNTPTTPRGGNVLDTDTRHRKVLRAGVQLQRYMVERLLEKHKKVEIRNTPGNHDIHSALVLDEVMVAVYEKEPRVIVHDSPFPFWAYRFGTSLVGIAHGHEPKPKTLPGLLANDYPKWWGEAHYKFCRHGHLHNKQQFTEIGVECEGFPTLAALDAWGSGQGYRAPRYTVAIVLHKEHGEVERHRASVRP